MVQTNNISMFDGANPFVIDKPIRLVELFGGIGAQAKALTNLGVPFEHHAYCEYDKYAVTSYNAIHGTAFKKSNIKEICADDLNIVDTDRYCYIMIYSFPCQDLSKAGKQKGMAKGGATRSGLLWEVERILHELSELPQVLVLENVPDIISSTNINDFRPWVEELEHLGYKNYYKLCNSIDYGIPQTRNRCIMVSILGDYFYEFPSPQALKLRLRDMLDKFVDEKYYIIDNQVELAKKTKFKQSSYYIKLRNKDVCGTLLARDYKDPKLIEVGQLCCGLYDTTLDVNRRVYAVEGIAPTLTTSLGGQAGVKIIYDTAYSYHVGMSDKFQTEPLKEISRMVKPNDTAVIINGRVRRLTPGEYYRLMGFSDDDYNRASQALRNKYYNGKDKANSQLYKQAGNSIVVDVLESIFRQMLDAKEIGK